MNDILAIALISVGIGFLAGLSVAIIAKDFGRTLTIEDIEDEI